MEKHVELSSQLYWCCKHLDDGRAPEETRKQGYRVPLNLLGTRKREECPLLLRCPLLAFVANELGAYRPVLPV